MHFITETLPLIGFGALGILLSMFIKINDINKANDNYTFNQVIGMFFHKEWASYGASFTVVLIAAFTHDEWLKNDQFMGYVKLSAVAFGFLGQHLLYKFWLGKMEKS